MLQALAVDHYMSLIGNEAHLIDFIKGVLDKQETYYNKILALADDDDDEPRLREAIQDAQVEQRTLKRKLVELEDDGGDNAVNDDNDNTVHDDNGNTVHDDNDNTVHDDNDNTVHDDNDNDDHANSQESTFFSFFHDCSQFFWCTRCYPLFRNHFGG